MFLLLARFSAQPMSYKALKLKILDEKGVICVEEETF